MCGICGIYNYRTGAPADESLVQKMTASVAHRGPDDAGFYFGGPIGLGMRRLSIIDVAGGHQPIANENNTCWIIFNGEIYNYPVLRRDLETRGHVFGTNSDTETILHAYEEWGLSALQRLNGMFGLAIWDSTCQRLLLARDHFGVKPLYYKDDGRRLLFGSELKSILQDPDVSRQVDEVALDQYLTFRFVPAPRTLLANIFKLPPGYYLVCDSKGSRLERFFCRVPSLMVGRTEADLVVELRQHLRDAVGRQMISDVPVGALLSGGLDSTTVVTLMQQLSREPVRTFTVGFADQGNFNELTQARKTAQRLGTQHHEVVLTVQDYVGFWPKAVWHLEEPIVTPSVLPMYFVSRLAHEYVKVVLTGQGADEPWAGYQRHTGEQWSQNYQRLPHAFRQRLLAPLAEALPRAESLKRAVRSLGEPDVAERFARVYSVFSLRQKACLYSGRQRLNLPPVADSVRVWQREVSHLDSLTQMMYVDARFSLADNLLMYGDKMAMAVSLEARVPMLDLELMAFVEDLPPCFKLHGCVHKYLFRKAIAEWLPPDVLQLPKHGFDTPMDRWLGRDLKDYVRDMWFSSDSACQIYFNVSYLKTLLDEHNLGRIDHRLRIFSLLSFEIWYQLFITQRSVEGFPM